MKFLSLIVVTVFLAACAGTGKTPQAAHSSKAELKTKPADMLASGQTRELENIAEDKLDSYVEKAGVVIAKTDFKGVMEKTYVKLFFQDNENAENKFDLYIGDKSAQQAFPWDAKTVRPGYFFVELPAGKYKISMISIPVGSTHASESIDIDLDVIPEEVTYLGTLQVNGTKEKIKLGGVPVIRPGFEYVAQVIDEQEEAIATFKQRYPNYPNDINIQLMKLNNATNKE